MARHIIGHGFRKDIGKGSTRGPEHRLRLHAEGQRLQRGSLEFDHEFPHSLWSRLARLAAVAQARRDAARKFRWKRFVAGPIEAIGELDLGPCRRGFLGYPHRDNIVVDFIVGWDFDELHRALAPKGFGLDPEARAPVVIDAILIMIKAAVALQQPKTARIFVREGRSDDT